MRSSLVGGAAAFGMTYALAPVVRRALVRWGAIDVPNHRSSHTQPVPRGGGLACLAGVATGLAVTGSASRIRPAAVVGIGALAATGFVDDRHGNLSPAARLAIQVSAGGLQTWERPLAGPLSALIWPGVVNVVNFMDGINGITGSSVAVWGLATLSAGRRAQDPTLQTLGAVTAGAGLGFLPWNAPKAHLFLGDVGSYLFGGLIAAGVVHAAQQPAVRWRVAAPLLPYVADAGMTLARRAARGKPLTEAHRDHAYQQLVDECGLSHETVAAMHALTATTTAAVAASPLPSPIRALMTLAATAGYVTSPMWLRDRKRLR